MSANPSFSSLLRALRTEAGLTQEEIAHSSGLSPRAIGDLERGSVRRPQRKTIALLATALGLAPDAAAALSAAARRVPQAPRAEGDAQLDIQPDGEAASEAAVLGPRQLPASVQLFTGRGEQLLKLQRWVADLPADDATTHVLTIDGMAGIGKTSLAVELGHALAERYPDGQLFLDLHGHTPGRSALTAQAALARLLRAIGVADDRFADDPDELAELWRSQVAGRRLLIVLDNAADTDHVRLLIPGHGGSLVLVTSRLRLLDLDAAASLSLDVLPLDQARALFARGAGEERVAGQETQVDEAVRLCGYLPLAIRIAAARLRHRPSWQVADLIDQLAESAVDGRGQVAAAFEMSYRRLDPAQQAMFRMLGLHPGTDIDPYAAAALAGLTQRAAWELLESLLDHHLIEQHEAGRYTFHDLMREYARNLPAAPSEDAAADCQALTRLIGHYWYIASIAMNTILPRTRHRRPGVDPPSTDAPTFGSAAEALAWLDVERPNLLALAVLAANRGLRAEVAKLSHITWRYFLDGGHHRDALLLHGLAVDAARAEAAAGGDRGILANALRFYGLTCERLGRFEESMATYQDAQKVCEEAGDPSDLAALIELQGNLNIVMGHYALAAENFNRSLALWKAQGNQDGVGNDLGNLGIIYFWLGRYEKSREHLSQALDLNREHGAPSSRAQSLVWLGVVAERIGQYATACAYQDEALALVRELGLHSFEADALEVRGLSRSALGLRAEALEDLMRSLEIRRSHVNQPSLCDSLQALGVHHSRHGQPERALEYFTQALGTTTDIGMPSTQTAARTGIGEALTALGRPTEALEHHRHALELAQPLGDPYRLARAHEGLAGALTALGRVQEAEPHLSEAHAAYRELGVPDAARL